MANYTGAVKFQDGTMLLFSYKGTTDIARRQLFFADEAVEHEQLRHVVPIQVPDEEAVDVIPYFMHGDHETWFTSKASKSCMLITGPVSMEEASRVAQANEIY